MYILFLMTATTQILHLFLFFWSLYFMFEFTWIISEFKTGLGRINFSNLAWINSELA